MKTMPIDDALIAAIVERIRRVCSPERIILYGSAATGQMTADSDVDLLILQSRLSDPLRERLRIADALRDLDFPFDVKVMATDYFDGSKDVIGGLAYPVNKRGKVVYEAA
jgi:predicted nucleotidyltransferase